MSGNMSTLLLMTGGILLPFKFPNSHEDLVEPTLIITPLGKDFRLS